MRTLFLDDDPERHANFAKKCPDAVHVSTHIEFAEALKGERFDVIHMDHDLGIYVQEPGMYDGQTREITGYDCCRFVLNLPQEKLPELIIIHSWNPDGANRMMRLLRDRGFQAICVPFEYQP